MKKIFYLNDSATSVGKYNLIHAEKSVESVEKHLSFIIAHPLVVGEVISSILGQTNKLH